MTFFGSTAFNGDGANRAMFQTIASFGGSYDDGNGKLKLNTPENVAAVAWLREMVQKGYVPEIAFAGGFQEEQAFMDSSAGAIPTGLFGYRYMNPLTAPSGKKYEKKSQDDMFDAITAGDVYLAPHACGPRQEAGVWHRHRGPCHSCGRQEPRGRQGVHQLDAIPGAQSGVRGRPRRRPAGAQVHRGLAAVPDAVLQAGSCGRQPPATAR